MIGCVWSGKPPPVCWEGFQRPSLGLFKFMRSFTTILTPLQWNTTSHSWSITSRCWRSEGALNTMVLGPSISVAWMRQEQSRIGCTFPLRWHTATEGSRLEGSTAKETFWYITKYKTVNIVCFITIQGGSNLAIPHVSCLLITAGWIYRYGCPRTLVGNFSSWV